MALRVPSLPLFVSAHAELQLARRCLLLESRLCAPQPSSSLVLLVGSWFTPHVNPSGNRMVWQSHLILANLGIDFDPLIGHLQRQLWQDYEGWEMGRVETLIRLTSLSLSTPPITKLAASLHTWRKWLDGATTGEGSAFNSQPSSREEPPGQSEIRAQLRRLLSAWLTSVVSSSPVLPPQ
ncbi:hypothetical protein KUCAC02_014365, partial [Chaenocephalus aceratus]